MRAVAVQLQKGNQPSTTAWISVILLMATLVPIAVQGFTTSTTAYAVKDNQTSTDSPAPAYAFGSWANIDIKAAAQGFVVAMPNQGFGSTIAFPAGFKFNFFGTDYTSIVPNSAGFLTFGSTAANPDSAPMSSAPALTVAPFWVRDTGGQPTLSAGCGGEVRYFVDSIPTARGAWNRVLIIQYTDVTTATVTSTGVGFCGLVNAQLSTFQVRLYEDSNAIEFHYKSALNGYNNRGIATNAGIRGPMPADAIQYPVATAASGASLSVGGVVVQFRPLGKVPAANDDPTTTTTYSYDYVANGGAGGSGLTVAATGVLANDRQIGAAPVQVAFKDFGAANPFAVTLTNAAGTSSSPSIGTDGSFRFKVGGANPCGSYTFRYTLDDAWTLAASTASAFPTALGTVKVDVVNCNNKPVATPQTGANAVTTPEDTPITITLAGTDLDTADQAGLKYCIDTAPSASVGQLRYANANPPPMCSVYDANSAVGGYGVLQLVYTPAAEYSNAAGDSFTFRAYDGQAVSPAAAVLVKVTSVNDPPVNSYGGVPFAGRKALNLASATSYGFSGSSALSVADVDATSLTVTLTVPSTAGSLSVTSNDQDPAPNIVRLVGTPGTVSGYLASLVYNRPTSACGQPYAALSMLADDAGVTAVDYIDLSATCSGAQPLSVSVSPTAATVAVNALATIAPAVQGGTAPVACSWSVTPSATLSAYTGCTSITFSSTTQGTFTVQLSASDAAPSTRTATATITVQQTLGVTVSPATANVPSGAPRQITPAMTGGTAPFTCAWTVLYADGTPVNTATTLSSTNSCTATSFRSSSINAAANPYKVKVTVTDAGSVTRTATSTLSVLQNQPPTADFTMSTAGPSSGEPVSFSDASTDDGQIVSRAWDFGDAAASTGLQPQHSYTNPGTFTVRLTVTDDSGATGTKTRTLTVGYPPAASPQTVPAPTPTNQGGNAPTPVAAAGADIVVQPGHEVILRGLANGASDGYFFSWKQIDGPAVELSDEGSAQVSFAAPLGSLNTPTKLVFQLIVSSGGTASLPDLVTVTIAPRGTPPVAVAGATGQPFVGSTMHLSANASYDADAESLQYVWTQVLGPNVTLLNARTATPSFVVPAGSVGTALAFELNVTDGNRFSIDTVQIVVKAPARAIVPPVVVEAQSPVHTLRPVARAHTSPGAASVLFGLTLLATAFVARRK